MAKKLPILLAKTWTPKVDPTGWWLSEKLDGVRAFWDGKQFLSRQSNVYHAPTWFTAGLPDFALDGELWLGRGRFQETVSIVRKLVPDDRWDDLQYMVFDAPFTKGDFELRYEILEDLDLRGYAEVVHQRICHGEEDLRVALDAIESVNGEGLMLRKPHSEYEFKRSGTLLKVKSRQDAEAVVTGHTRGRGKYREHVGALICKAPDGRVFEVGTGLTDADRAKPPKIGAVITYKHQGLTDDGLPRFPVYFRVRSDLP